MLLAQEKTHGKLKKAEPTTRKMKAGELERRIGGKGNIKRKSKGLQKAYFRKQSKKSKYPGNIYVNPKPKDFTAIKERTAKPGPKTKLKGKKLRGQYFKASKGSRYNTFGGNTVVKQNSKLSYKYASKVISKNKGNVSVKAPRKSYRQASRKVQKHSGNIFLQPEAKRTDFDAIKAREQKRPGKSMARQSNNRKGRMQANAALTQSYSGDIVQKSRKSHKKTYEYDSKAIQKNKGQLRAGKVKSSANQRRYSSAMAANYNGDIVLPARNKKRLQYEYSSKVYQNYKGGLKKASKSMGPQFATKYAGSLRRQSKKQHNQELQGKSLNYASASGNVPVYSRRKQGRVEKRGAKMTGNYTGDLRGGLTRKQKNQALQGKSLNMTSASGNVPVYSRKRQARLAKKQAGVTATYAGRIRGLTRKQRYQELQGKSMNFTEYEGDIAVLSRKKQDKFMTRDSKITGSYSGNIRGLSKKQHNQELQGKALNMSSYQGEIKLTRRQAKIRKPQNDPAIAGFQGDIVVTARERKKLEYQYLSKVQHNYTGEIKLKKYSKWLNGRKGRSNEMANYQGEIN